MILTAKTISRLERVAAHPALDFANTVSWRGKLEAIDYLRSYDDLLVWSRLSGLLPAVVATKLEKAARRTPRRATTALERARALRESIFAVGWAIAHADRVPERALRAIHAARLAALAHAHLAPVETGGWVPAWPSTPPYLDRPWWPVAVSFATLLEIPPAHPLGACPGCSWLYLDLTRNHSRRWCSSGDCGNRARGRRFRARHRPR